LERHRPNTGPRGLFFGGLIHRSEVLPRVDREEHASRHVRDDGEGDEGDDEGDGEGDGEHGPFEVV
jgi:hypothetical protein